MQKGFIFIGLAKRVWEREREGVKERKRGYERGNGGKGMVKKKKEEKRRKRRKRRKKKLTHLFNS